MHDEVLLVKMNAYSLTIFSAKITTTPNPSTFRGWKVPMGITVLNNELAKFKVALRKY
jgi:hypothetical protein